MAALPIYEVVPQLKQQLAQANTLILQAPPGAGKSTVLPLELLNEPWLQGLKILMLEPRRLAARSVAMRLASQLGEEVGQTVGYRVRFDHKVGKNTRIEVLTEGILTRLLQQDNTLEGVGLLIFDEFHERSLHADLALALSREAQSVLREDLRILLMSATLDGEKLAGLLGNAPIITSQGRQYPLQYHYLGDHKTDPIWQRMATAIRKALKEQEGDILAFLPGVAEIQKTVDGLRLTVDREDGNSNVEHSTLNVELLPLYGELSVAEQQAAIQAHPKGKRKVVLATSIAETSLTIEGVKIVVDSGLARVPKFDPRSGLTRLETLRVTQDAADQRAGRAGRLGPGVCYRLWSEATHHHLQAHRSPEIEEADLAPLVLELANWGVQDPRSLTWLSPPPASAVTQAKEVLEQLEALENGKVTTRGKEMLRLPTHPRLAHLLLEGERLGLSSLAADVAAILEERDPLPRDTGANLALRIEALYKWRKKEYVNADRHVLERIDRLALTWRRTVDGKQLTVDRGVSTLNLELSTLNYEHVGLLIAAAYPERVAKQRDNDSQRYRLANGRIAKLPERDELDREPWLAIAHLDAGSQHEGKIYLAAPLNIKDLEHQLQRKRVVAWDTQKGQLIARMERCFGDIMVSSTPLDIIPEEERLSVLCEAVKQEGLKLLPWSETIEQWQARLLSLRHWRPSEDWPDVSTNYLINSVEDWLAPFLTQVRKREDFQKLDLFGILQGLLTWDKTQQLDTLAPEKLKVPSGFDIPLQYFADGRDPVLAVRLQEMFGLLDTPTINEGRTKVLLHLLSPGYKPQQVTQDLKSFWQNTYPEVRKELRMRYPKHHWPEDPWTAEAVRGVKKRV
jgi:ATP-dependent helicase HrpB